MADSEKDAEALSRLQVQARDEVARKEIAEAIRDRKAAERQTAAQVFPSSTTEGLTGNASVEKGAGYSAEILAFQTLRDAAKTIVNSAAKLLTDDAIILTDKISFSSVSALHSLMSTKLDHGIRALERSIGNSLGEEQEHPPSDEDKQMGGDAKEASKQSVAAASIMATIGAAADIAAFFKTNVSIQSEEITLRNHSLLVEIARVLRNHSATKHKEIFVPGWGPQVSHSLTHKVEQLAQKIDLLRHRRIRLRNSYQDNLDTLANERNIRDNIRQEYTQWIASPNPDRDRMSYLQNEIATIEETIRGLVSVESQWTKEVGEIDDLLNGSIALLETVTSSNDSAPSPLEATLDYDVLARFSEAKVLQAEIVSQGAELAITKSLFFRDKISYTGGSVVAYVITDREGNVLASGSHPNTRTANRA